ncbi:MAG: hypothetical protein N3F07_03220 [Candidatus Micrarchaeota archaeon]|nr:hypothetical protein [Candidatus Micrarchaeota archaeon]
MPHTCNRCRTQYEIGMFDSGHDYCMTCYVRIQEERRKKAEQERREQEKREAKKQKLISEIEAKLYEQRKESEHTNPQRVFMSGADLKRMRHFGVGEIYAQKKEAHEKPLPEQIKHPSIYAASALKKSLPPAKADRDYAGSSPIMHMNIPQEEDEGNITISAIQGLPVSLSCGQKNIQVLLAGKNGTGRKINAELVHSLADSSGKSVEARAQPEKFSLEPGAEQEIKIEFSLPESARSGPLVLNAYIRETAAYVDRQPAKSQPLQLTSEVKTPMELAYIPKSSRLASIGEAMALQMDFQNLGESGGILSMKSNVRFGQNDSQLAWLTKKAKIKGKQKRITLEFAPVKKTEIQILWLELLGVDSNGKEYSLKKVIEEKIKDGS